MMDEFTGVYNGTWLLNEQEQLEMLLKVITNRTKCKKEDNKKKLRNCYKEANDHVSRTDNEQIKTTRVRRI
jgi:hypothetical protein